jgi:hypothetical protein
MSSECRISGTGHEVRMMAQDREDLGGTSRTREEMDCTATVCDTWCCRDR